MKRRKIPDELSSILDAIIKARGSAMRMAARLRRTRSRAPEGFNWLKNDMNRAACLLDGVEQVLLVASSITCEMAEGARRSAPLADPATI